MLHDFLQFFLSLDQHLMYILTTYDVWAYGILFLIIFCETGLIIMPFLPGDSLLFIAGSLCSQASSSLTLPYLIALLVFASWLGNQTNFHIGKWVGKKVFAMKDTWYLNAEHLHQAHVFYQRHGKLTLVLARFLPIIRTFAPFVAGAAAMDTRLFTLVNLCSAVLWICSLLVAGYVLGQVAFVQTHLSVVIYGIIALSLLPLCLSYCRHKRRAA